nr:MAG TPA: hypothetical protein [Caudoviricetes sp.]
MNTIITFFVFCHFVILHDNYTEISLLEKFKE